MNSQRNNFFPGETSFWTRFLTDTALRNYDDLEKLLIGCELIAALDDLATLEA